MLKLLLMELGIIRDVVASLLLNLISGQLVLYKRKTVWMRKRLIATVWVEAIVYRRCVSLRVERTLASTCAVGRTSRVGLDIPKLDVGVADLAIAIAVTVRCVGSVPEAGFHCPQCDLRVWITIARHVGILGTVRIILRRTIDADGWSVSQTRILLLV